MTYVYCVVRSATTPRLARVPRGLAGMGAARTLPIEPRLFAIVATAPAARYNERAIARGLVDLDWVSRAAVAHDAVVEHFTAADAVLPMKLFTIFNSDDRALDHLRAERVRLRATAQRVARQQEWGVRVLFDRSRATERARSAPSARRATGVDYLTRKQAHRAAAAELSTRAHDTVVQLYDRLAARARDARRRATADLPDKGSLLLDAAFLVPRSRAASFRALAARESRMLAPHGYAVSLTGPWPPYTFVQDS